MPIPWTANINITVVSGASSALAIARLVHSHFAAVRLQPRLQTITVQGRVSSHALLALLVASSPSLKLPSGVASPLSEGSSDLRDQALLSLSRVPGPLHSITQPTNLHPMPTTQLLVHIASVCLVATVPGPRRGAPVPIGYVFRYTQGKRTAMGTGPQKYLGGQVEE